MCFCFVAATEGLLVKVPEKKKVAMLFEPALLRCDFSTSSNQPAVVQWRFKSYCQDRMGEALGMATSGLQAVSKRNLEWDPYLDCVDSRRTVRVVASKQGSAVTIGDFYKGRDVTIVHGNSAPLAVLVLFGIIPWQLRMLEADGNCLVNGFSWDQVLNISSCIRHLQTQTDDSAGGRS